ncbi:MAG: hypothetical protein WBK09_00920 [Limnohabitans sp.]|uniref:hypothetical protein n=1 Tax=Limnohabitans sp. TaxID=1907725 RepID=UPI003C753D6E
MNYSTSNKISVFSKRYNIFNFALSLSAKGFTVYLKILFIISLFLAGVGFAFTGNMVIYAQNYKHDSMQVFFPVDGAYSEENSVRPALYDNAKKSLTISLPLTPIGHIRIDPANEATEIVIEKIEFSRLFGVDKYLPKDLLLYAKPLQDIDKLEVTPAGLLIRSTGNDPAFELILKKSSDLYQFIILGIIGVFLSIAVFLCIKKFTQLKMPAVTNVVYIWVIPLFFSLGIAVLFYPGFMSYDTLHALRGARNGVIDSMWPPMVSYVWRVVDLVSVNPSAMHLSQIFLLLFSVVFIVFTFTKQIKYVAVFLPIYLSIPSVLGTLAVIWKDVLMAAFFLAAFAVINSMRRIKNRRYFIFLFLFSTSLIFLGVCSRHNAITGAVPLLFYLALIACSGVIKSCPRLWLAVFFLGTMLTGTVFLAKTQLDNYSLPSFEKMSNSNDFFVRTVRVLDVAGASLCVGGNLFADIAPNLSLNEIKAEYDPRHINLSKGLLDKVVVDSRIDGVWLNVAVHHPVCFLSYKFDLTKYMIGANKGIQFLITAPSVDKNEYGYQLPNSSIRDATVKYIVHASALPFFKPWFFYLLSIGSLIYLIFTKALTPAHVTLFMSAIFYMGGLVLFGNAADARLLFYTTTVLSMFTFISIFEFRKRH